MKMKRTLILTQQVIEEVLEMHIDNLRVICKCQMEIDDAEILLELRAKEREIREIIRGLKDLLGFFEKYDAVIVVERDILKKL